MKDWIVGSTWQQQQQQQQRVTPWSSSWLLSRRSSTSKAILACCCYVSLFGSSRGETTTPVAAATESTVPIMKGPSSHWIYPTVPNSLGQKIPYLDSNGDYSREQWLEDARLPLYSKQATLPRLPVPTLEETLATFRPTALPLALENQLHNNHHHHHHHHLHFLKKEKDGEHPVVTEEEAAKELETFEAACAAFPAQAEYLQKRLLKRAHLWNDKKHSSWLQELWNQQVYLQYRDPTVIHVSYYFRPSLSHTVHEAAVHLQPHAGSLLLRGAIVLKAAVEYAEGITTGRNAPTVIGHGAHSTVLCSTPYKYLFHSCRIPAHPADYFRVYKSAAADAHAHSHHGHGHEEAQQPQENLPLHALVICRNQFFAVPVTDKTGKALSLTTLEKALEKVILRAFSAPLPSIPELGWLTCSPRDVWATNYHDLFLQHADLSAALETLQSAVTVLALDLAKKPVLHPTARWHSSAFSASAAATTEQAKRLWHGNVKYSANRWHDKSGHVILDAHGVLGYLGEHAMADGMPAADFCQHLLHQLVKIQQEHEDQHEHHKKQQQQLDHHDDKHSEADSKEEEEDVVEPVLIFEQAFQNMSPEHRAKIDAAVEAAKQEMLHRIAEHDLELLNYDSYGRTEMKASGYAPDAFVQMAMQLASYRLFGRTLVGTYEATQTRKFLHGRTETTRTVSPQALAFCKAMTDSPQKHQLSIAEKQALLHAAIDSHAKYTHKAVDGKGVDRHFFGLRACMQEGDVLPDLLQHPLFVRSKTWTLSTSTVPQASPGFGTVEPNGLGIGYDLRNDGCIFSIAAMTKTGYVHRMATFLAHALDEMAALCHTAVEEANAEDSPAKTFLRLVN